MDSHRWRHVRIGRWRPVIVFEACRKSTGQYGVTPDDIYSLVVTDLGYELSTMRRWLRSRRPYTREECRHNWVSEGDFYFIASAAR